MVHVQDEVGGEYFFHETVIDAIDVKGPNEALNHAGIEVILGDTLSTAFSNAEEQTHHARHASDEVECIFFPVTRGVQHAQGMDTDAQPIHGMSVGWQRVEHGSKAFWHPSSGTKVGLERFRLLWRGQFLVEQEVDDVFGRELGQFSDGIATVMNAFCGRDKGGSACPYRDASQAGVEVGGVDGEQWLILRHLSSPATAETHGRYKCGSRMAPLEKFGVSSNT